MVLEQEKTGGPGWWLCSLHGKQGIVPANRLKILQTAPPTGSEPSPGPKEDSVYLSPGPPLAWTAVSGSAENADGVYLSPPVTGEGRGGAVATRTGELRRVEAGRPRSHSSSGTRPRPDWDFGVVGRPRSPSLRGRGSEMSGTLYQKPLSPMPSAPLHARQPGGVMASESVYLSPSGVSRANDEPEDTTYLVPREKSAVGHSDDCYLVPKGTPLASDDVYQSPTGGGVNSTLCADVTSGISVTPQSKAGQDTPEVYQTPTPVGSNPHRPPATVLAHQNSSPLTPTQASPRPLLKGVPPSPASVRGKPGMVCHRGSPLLIRAGQARAPGSPNFARKPPPPAPPVRSVTRKDAQQTAPSPAVSVPKPTTQAGQLRQEDKQLVTHQGNGEKMSNGLDRSCGVPNKAGEQQDDSDAAGDQVRFNNPAWDSCVGLFLAVVAYIGCFPVIMIDELM